MRPELVSGDVGVVDRSNEGHDHLAPVLIRLADHRALAHCGVRRQHGLDLDRVDVLAAPDDHVLAATGQVEVTLLVAEGEIATPDTRSEERRVGKECDSTCTTRGSPSHK